MEDLSIGSKTLAHPESKGCMKAKIGLKGLLLLG